MERLPPSLHASVRRVLRQAWEMDKAEKLIRNLARRLEHQAPGVSGSILEGLDEMLTVVRLGLPTQQVCRNVKRWRTASMALRWTAAAMLEAKKGFRKLKAYKQLPVLRMALKARHQRVSNNSTLAQQPDAA